MKEPYRFVYKAVAVFLYGIFAMGIGYCGIYLLLSYASPANLPAALSDHTGLLTLGLGFCCLGLLATLTYLMRGAGRRPEAEGFFPGWQEKIPLDLYLLLSISALCAILTPLVQNLPNWIYTEASLLIALPGLAVFALLILALLMTLATRFKLGGWWRNTVIYWVLSLCLRFLRWLWRSIRGLFDALPAIWPVALLSGVFLFAAFLMGATGMYSSLGVLLWLGICGGVFLLCCYGAIQFGAIQKVTEQLAEGKLEAKVHTEKLLPPFRRHGEAVNRIGQGIHKAVAEQLKSERFKTELITNVSHDLKTPLTSIVNYVDLLGKEQLDNPRATEYVAVLRRQAQRLKKLTEDLVEASKASSGAMAVNRVPMELGELLSQCNAEYAERLLAANLELVTDCPAGVQVLADGRLLWRVFDNLLGNACKYSQPGTRVYITVEAAQEQVLVQVKNISREVLNVTPEALMERFVRGDSSRSAEGSGLGLSIAKSLMELNEGKLELAIDGDLFKAILTMEKP
ncbi:MAG TPA: HAMP domain-containing histidine kinase [Candidatus Pelethousia gallinarum]|nr:HAMP domain-containing histidine kinase [Candidatus Pelethousia gallinarum]